MKLEFPARPNLAATRKKPVAPRFGANPAVGSARSLTGPAADRFLRVHRASGVKFGSTETLTAPTAEEVAAAGEKLFNPEVVMRFNALKTLMRAETLDETTKRKVARYLFFEDTFTNSGDQQYRLQNRLMTMQLVERHKIPVGAEAAALHIVEYGNANISKYAAALISRVYPVMSEREKTRVRALLYTFVTTDRTSTSPGHTTPLLGAFAPAGDANYVWYLHKDSAWKGADSGTQRRIFTQIMAREHGLPFLEALHDLLVELSLDPEKFKGEAPDINAGDVRQMVTDYPFHILSLSRKQIEKMPPAELDRTIGLLTDSYLLMQKGSSKISVDQGMIFAKALSRLSKQLPLGKRRAYIESLPPKLLGNSSDSRILLILMLEYLYQDRYGLNAIRTHVENRLSSNSKAYESVLQDIEQRAKDYPYSPKSLGLLAPSSVVLSEKPDDPIYEDLINPDYAPTDKSLMNACGLSMELLPRGPFTAKFPPLENIDAIVEPEPMLPVRYRSFDQMAELLDKAIESRDDENISKALQPFMYSWLVDNHRYSYQHLKKLTRENPQVFSRITQYLQKMSKGTVKMTTGLVGGPDETTFMTRKEMEGHWRQIALLLSDSIENYPGQLTPTLLDFSMLHAEMAKADPALRPFLVHSLSKTIAMETEQLAERKKANGDKPDPMFEKVRLEHLGNALFSILKMGYSEELIRIAGPALQSVIPGIPPEKLLKNEPVFSFLDWADVSVTGLEGKVEADSASPGSKKDFDLLVNVALALNDTETLAKAVNRLYEYFLKLRTDSYADENYFGHFLGNPKLVDFVLNQKDDALFDRFTEMQGWYKSFETVPQMVAHAAEKNVPFRVSGIMAAITAMGSFVRPDLEKIAETGTARERGIARAILKRMDTNGFDWEAFYPYPYPLPPTLMKRLGQLENPGGPENTPGQKTGFTEANEANAIDLDALLAEQPDSPTGSEVNPFAAIDRFVEAQSPVDFMELDDLALDGAMDVAAEPENQTMLDKLKQAFLDMRRSDADSRSRYAKQLTVLAKQFGEMALSGNSDIAFISEEKTELANTIARSLDNATDQREALAMLDALEVLGGDPDVVVPQVIRILDATSNFNMEEQRIAAMKILGNLNQGGLDEVRELTIRQGHFNDLRRQGIKTLTLMRDGEGLLEMLERRGAILGMESVECQTLIAEALGSVVPGDAELEERTRNVLLDLMKSVASVGSVISRPSKTLMAEMVKTICLCVDNPADTELFMTMHRILEKLRDPRDAKLELITAVNNNFFDFTPEIREALEKYLRDEDTVVRRKAQETLVAKLQAES